mmetsp:Transcript_17082/g.25743  ORF Transcript_17082/g.25743 Transcript_17082/m.25743 type:complete len:512 (-) Transcript_17082:92-1627(-)
MVLRYVLIIFNILVFNRIERAHGALKVKKDLQQAKKAMPLPLQSDFRRGAIYQKEDELKVKKSNDPDLKKGILCVIGGILCHMVLGTLYCWGNFIAYCPPKLLYYTVSEQKGQPDALGIIPLTILFQMIAMPIGAQVAKRLGTRVASLSSGAIIAFAIYSASFAQNLRTFMIFYAALFGLGVGLGYTSPMVAGWTWFPKSRGVVNGCVLLGYGCGGALANIIGSKFVNPGGKMMLDASGRFPSELYERFPFMLRRLAMIYACASTLGGLNVVSKKQQIDNFETPQPQILKVHSLFWWPLRRRRNFQPKAVLTKSIKSMSLIDAAKTPTFWALYGIVILTASAGITAASIYKLFATASPVVALAGDQFLATTGALASLFNGIGRLGWASAVDAFGYKKTFTTLLIIQALNTAFYPVAARISPAAFMIATCIAYFLLGGIFSTSPTCCALAFGPESAALIYGALFSAFGIASISGVQLAKSLIPTLGWKSLYRALALTTLMAAPFIKLLNVPS